MSKEVDRTALRLKALAHPARLRIVQCLDRRGHCCCGDVCAELPLAQSTISQHLDLLCKAGLVRLQPDGNRSRYTIDREALNQLAGAIQELGARKATS
jgi:ArsR family transcriptional regulator, arsenate/arsenite/antimonite-responsive transcriptional repressor